MKKLLFLFSAVLFSATTLYSQGKEIVYVENFSYSNKIGSSYVESLRNKIIEGLVKTDRIIVKDVNSEASLQREKTKHTENAADVDEATLIQMKNLHAKYLIQGHITTLEALKSTDKEGKTTYHGSIVFALKVVDVQKGTLVGSESYTYAGSGTGLFATGAGDTPDQAIDKTMSSVETDMKKFIDEYFPLEGTILEVAAEKKGKVTEVYIDLGKDHGMQKGQGFNVFTEREIAGRTSLKKIGDIKIESVEGDDISLCKVGKGGEEIKAAVGEGQKIVVKSYFKAKGLLEF